MLVSIIVAASANNVIGVDGGLPWHISEDLKRFRQITMGKPMIMGRLTYESIGRALPGRRSIVLTRQDDFVAQDCELAGSPQEALQVAGTVDEVMIIGGGKVYEQMLPLVNRVYLTRIHTEIDGDTYFPSIDASEWQLVSSEVFPQSESRPVGFTFEILDRK